MPSTPRRPSSGRWRRTARQFGFSTSCATIASGIEGEQPPDPGEADRVDRLERRGAEHEVARPEQGGEHQEDDGSHRRCPGVAAFTFPTVSRLLSSAAHGDFPQAIGEIDRCHPTIEAWPRPHQTSTQTSAARPRSPHHSTVDRTPKPSFTKGLFLGQHPVRAGHAVPAARRRGARPRRRRRRERPRLPRARSTSGRPRSRAGSATTSSATWASASSPACSSTSSTAASASASPATAASWRSSATSTAPSPSSWACTSRSAPSRSTCSAPTTRRRAGCPTSPPAASSPRSCSPSRTSASDAYNLETWAERQADGSWLLNGEKRWIGNGDKDVLTVFARSDLGPRRPHRREGHGGAEHRPALRHPRAAREPPAARALQERARARREPARRAGRRVPDRDEHAQQRPDVDGHRDLGRHEALPRAGSRAREHPQAVRPAPHRLRDGRGEAGLDGGADLRAGIEQLPDDRAGGSRRGRLLAGERDDEGGGLRSRLVRAEPGVPDPRRRGVHEPAPAREGAARLPDLPDLRGLERRHAGVRRAQRHQGAERGPARRREHQAQRPGPRVRRAGARMCRVASTARCVRRSSQGAHPAFAGHVGKLAGQVVPTARQRGGRPAQARQEGPGEAADPEAAGRGGIRHLFAGGRDLAGECGVRAGRRADLGCREDRRDELPEEDRARGRTASCAGSR